MARLLGEAYVQITEEDLTWMRGLLSDPSFAHAVGTENLVKYAALIEYASRNIHFAGNITMSEELANDR